MFFNRLNWYVLLAFFLLSGRGQKLIAQQDNIHEIEQDGKWLIPSSELNKTRLGIFIGTGTLAYTATLIGLNELWYADYPRGKFKFINDAQEWQQLDKAGHTLTPYLEARYLMEVIQWCGVEHKKAAIYAGLTAFMLQNTIEVFDGYSAEWGASASDIAANFVGSAIMTGQELAWGEQRIMLKILPHFVNYPEGELENRAKQLYGNSIMVRSIKDYNSLNIWMSVNPASFNKNQKHLKWLNIALGYGVGDMYGGYSNSWVDEDGKYHDRTDIVRYRKLLFSVDVDFTRINTSSRYLKVMLGLLNIIKVPAPTIEFNSKGQVLFHPLM